MQRLIKSTCKIAAEEIGKERAGRIAAKAQRRFEELCQENAADTKALRAHTFQRIYPAIAVYEALREDGINEERAAWYIREHFQRFAAAFAPHLRRAITVLGIAKRIPALFMTISVKSFGADAGFEYEFPVRNLKESLLSALETNNSEEK
ncbi:MAG: hypothetical protein II881_00330 [Oscillospiraceae bacterium]|nr:hypothetical protein [Oscillospiraceae bacterium]